MHESSMDKKWRPSFRNDADPNCPGCHGTGVVGYEYCNRPHIRDCYCIQPQPANATSLGVERNDDGPNANPEPQPAPHPAAKRSSGGFASALMALLFNGAVLFVLLVIAIVLDHR